MISRTVPAPVLVLGSVVTVQFGQALGKGLFGAAGVAGVVSLRLAFAALLLLLLWRPRWPGRASAGLVAALGAAIAGMHLIYPAIERLPVGVASTVQFLGPLGLALARSRRAADVGWAALAAAGVVLINGPGGVTSVSGVLLALGSGAFMALYLVLNKRAGARSADGSTLAWAVAFAALLALPFGAFGGGTRLLHPGLLAAGAGVALLSAAVPWSLDLAALRRLPERVLAVMVSLEPAAAAIAGIVLLDERLSWTQWAAVGCVSAASAGAVLTGRDARRGTRPAERRDAREDARAGRGRDAAARTAYCREAVRVPARTPPEAEAEGVRACPEDR
ncbi:MULTISPECIES: EamA family transporter [Actinomadura]|uniref:DMT family transporter n=1 Tax=Actinomadura yumaensis TaxID=111807 RepID=A0ABW2CQI0_9ACTN|nr:EamA family transporter [Actinomadura sp. J1-007]